MNGNRTKTRRSGFVIVVVLCLIIMMTALLLGFNKQTRRNLRATKDAKESAQALNNARAGLNIAIAAIRQADRSDAGGDMFDLLAAESTVEFDQGQCTIAVHSESGKLNVNMLKATNGTVNRIRTDQLLRLIDVLNRTQPQSDRIGYGLVPAIMDWTDSDNSTTTLTFVARENSGAEAAYYKALDQPYACTNTKLRTTDELRLVKGLTPDIYERLADYVTVYGKGKVNINFAPKIVIQSLSPRMDSAMAQMIVNQRRIRPFSSVAELRQVSGMTEDLYQAISNFVTTQTADQYYRVAVLGTVRSAACAITAVLKRNPETRNIEVVLYTEA